MTALVSVVLSYAALATSNPGASATAGTCTLVGDACEFSEQTAAPETYATPAEVDCRAAKLAPTAADGSRSQLFTESCSFPIFDFRYRVSRVPDSERPNGSLRPQRGRRATQTVATTSGLPREPGGLASTASAQPLAVYALGALTPPTSTEVKCDSNRRAPIRVVEPLERPPRA